MAPAPAVMFDLYGTLVPAFRRREHEESIANCAEILNVGFELLHQGWVDTFPDRILGRFPSVAANFVSILSDVNLAASDDRLLAAEDEYLEFTRSGIAPNEETLACLAQLRDHGVQLGLLTNCAPDVPKIWPETPLAEFFSVCGFSCEMGIAKPDERSYQKVVADLGFAPSEFLYVGDGSDDELAGARAVGLNPVLLITDLSNTYDKIREGVLSWDGPQATSLTELLADAGF